MTSRRFSPCTAGLPIGVIVGCVISGVVLLILLVIIGILCFLRRRRRMQPVRIKAKLEDQTLTPFVLPPKPDRPITSCRAKYTRPPPAASVPKSVTPTTFSSSLWVEARTNDTELTTTKGASSPRGTAPTRETRKPSPSRRRATAIRGEQSFLDMESVISAPSSTARSSVKYSSSPVSTGDAEMRRQFQLLEKELGGLTGRTGSDSKQPDSEGLVSPIRTQSPPPAYG